MNQALSGLTKLFSSDNDDLEAAGSSGYGGSYDTTLYVTGLGASLSKGGGHGHSGYGHSGHGGHKTECCPLVVDPLTFSAILGFLGLATALLNTLITTSLGRRKKRSDGSFDPNETKSVVDMAADFVFHGRS